MSNVAIKVENLSKIYRLGEIGTGTISRDIERWIKMKLLSQEDPFLKIGETNKRENKGSSDIIYSLQNINFDINQGEAVGIIGRNGAGKSTLLKVLSRVTTPSAGKIKIKGRVASLLEVGTGFHPELTGRENIYLNGAILGMRKREIDTKLDEIINFSGVERYIDTPVKRYSSGMYVRLAFAVAAHLESEILVVDEVLAVGDSDFQKKCLGKMGEVTNGQGRTVLFVSHDVSAINRLCNKGIYLKDGQIVETGKIGKVIDSYIKESIILSSAEGEIPIGRSTYNTGEMRFTKCLINGNSNRIGFAENFKLFLELESQVEINNCFLDVRFVNNEMLEISHSTHVYNSNNDYLNLKTGVHQFEVCINNCLQPGNYFVSIGIHKNNGDTQDQVELIGPVEVSTISVNDGNDFIFPAHWPLGSVRLDSTWKQLI